MNGTIQESKKPTGSETEQEILELGNELVRAELEADVSFLEDVMANDFMAIGPRGFILTQPEWIARHKFGDLKYQSLTLDEPNVRIYGSSAILTGRETQEATCKGHAVPGPNQFRVTYVFTRQGPEWKLVSLQMSPILGPF